MRGSLFLSVTAALASLAAAQPPRDTERFELTVRPLLARHCVECHGPAQQKGNLRLDRAVTAEQARKVAAALRYDGPVQMPPSGKLRDDQSAPLIAWAKAGAPFPAASAAQPATGLWSLQPLKPAACATIDSLIATKLRANGLTVAPPADRRTLIRRATVDVTGLPPTAAEVAAFVADRRPDAYERLVDRLLASPAYGERWARYWLDLVRYADSNGYERDAEKPFSWKYRDWVIESLNADKPYDRFVTEQLAGDEMPGRSPETLAATGLLRLGTWDDEPNDAAEYQYERLDDLVHVASTAFLGLTVRCARCHDHKFDPIPQKDYYALASAFWAGYVSGGGPLGGPPPEKLPFPDTLGFTDRGPSAPPLRLLKGGDPHRPEAEVGPGFLSSLPALDRPVLPPPPGATTTHRRLQLAAWIVDPRNPLTARVAVNRIWQGHFGRGLVATPDNFGVKGDLPTHPELLDTLAAQFVAGGWKLKPIHRQILLSKTYRQASLHPDPARGLRVDPLDTLLWRYPRRRLDADALRDAMLQASGALNPQRGGRGFVPTVTREALEGLSRKGAEWIPSPPEQQNRRSIYVFLKRALIPPLLTTFDFGDTTAPLAQRDVTTVAPQALALLNNPWLHEQGAVLARRVRRDAGVRLDDQVRTAWRLALGRSPSPTETNAALAYLHRESLAAPEPAPRSAAALPADSLRLHLRVDTGVETESDGRVRGWKDLSGNGFDAAAGPGGAPRATADGIRFDDRASLTIAAPVVTSQAVTIVAVVRDRGAGSHREIFSNWNGSAGNAGTSLFLGTTGAGIVRFTDSFAPAGVLTQPERLHALTAVADATGAMVFQDRREIAHSAAPLPPRTLTPPFVLGTQGNIGGEYWRGEIVALLVWNRALSAGERATLWDWLAERYPVAARPEPVDPALASLCRVLLNTNEFAYID